MQTVINNRRLARYSAKDQTAFANNKALTLSRLKQLASLLGRNPWLLVFILVISVLSVLLEGVGLGVVLALLQGNTTPANGMSQFYGVEALAKWLGSLALIRRVQFAAVALVAITLLRQGMTCANQLLTARQQLKLEHYLKLALFQQLHAVEIRFIYRQSIGHLLTFLNSYVSQTISAVQKAITLVINLVPLLVYTGLMMIISWQLTLIALGLILGLLLLSNYGLTGNLDQVSRAEKSLKKEMKANMVESLAGMKMLHLYSKESHSLAQFETKLEAYQTHSYEGMRLVSVNNFLFNLLNVIALCIIMLAATFLLPTQTEAWLSMMVL
ncbi:MAG: ABC transporter ATP-binding protein, partial [Anaerolineae bacterium]|nr:ABC transporter ATP-binding protein [Anaerolineae bacterium]